MNRAAIRFGVLPAAGRGVRAWPKTHFIPKVMLEVGGKPLLQRNLEILRDQFGLTEIVVIVGHLGEQIRAFLGDGSRFQVRVTYVECADPAIGLARGLMLARSILVAPFVTILGDELYLGSNHARLLRDDDTFDAACAVLQTSALDTIRKNYAVSIDGDRIVGLEEKPERILNDLLGCGTYVFDPSIFAAIERTAPSPRSGRIELTDAIATLVRDGKHVKPLHLTGSYVNINSIEDQNSANYLVRNLEFSTYKVSVVIPAWNEEGSIGYVVRDFAPLVHEVVVADNRSTDKTAEIARACGARVVTTSLKGYGDALRCGIDHATGDLIVLVEADHSFRAKDLGKLLEFAKDADMVIGTRTTRQMIEQGTNMHGIVRWANVMVGKLIEALWWSQEPRFTDVGCTYRAIWRDVWTKIRPRVHGIGPEFSPELMIEVLRDHRRVIEIPVSYYRRVAGTSKHSAGFTQLARTALRMLRLIVRKRLGRD